jgi:hypothetical protein
VHFVEIEINQSPRKKIDNAWHGIELVMTADPNP